MMVTQCASPRGTRLAGSPRLIPMTADEWNRLGEAIVVWTGWGRSSFPSRDEARLANHFGPGVAAELLPLIRELEDDFYSSDARLTAVDLANMARISMDEFMKKHPELPHKAAQAL